MRKAFLSVLILSAMFFPLDPAKAASSAECDLGMALMQCVINNSNIIYTEHEFITISEGCANRMPALMAQQAKVMIDTYGTMMWELHSNGMSPEEIMVSINVCDGGSSSCNTCEVGSATTSTINIANGKRETKTARGYCKTGCTCPGTCPDEVSYTCTCNSGYEIYRQGSSDCFCDKKYCVAGQYLNSSNNCVNCPTAAGFSPTSEEWTVVITGCYIPKDSASKDSKGGYKFTSNCYYVQ